MEGWKDERIKGWKDEGAAPDSQNRSNISCFLELQEDLQVCRRGSEQINSASRLICLILGLFQSTLFYW